MESLGERTATRRLLCDARAERGEPPTSVREAMWGWLRSQRAFELIAFVVSEEITVARVNMKALSERLGIRAFLGVHEAHRWLARGVKPSTITGQFTALTTPPSGIQRTTTSSSPPPPLRSSVPPSRSSSPPPPPESGPQSIPPPPQSTTVPRSYTALRAADELEDQLFPKRKREKP